MKVLKERKIRKSTLSYPKLTTYFIQLSWIFKWLVQNRKTSHERKEDKS